jgi:peptide/nickel transport system substrate-binding protein
MKKSKKTLSENGITRRTFINQVGKAGAIGLILSTGIPPAKAAGKKNLVYGAFGGDPGNLSPVIRFSPQGGIFMNNIFDCQTRTDYSTGAIVPELAESWKNIDPLTWRIKIREGATWHKGYGEVTAEDVVYTWNFHISTKTWQSTASLDALSSIKAVDRYVLEVKLKYPYGPFPGVCMGYAGQVISKNAHKEMGNKQYSRNPIGSGPFIFESLSGNEVVVKKNQKYWRKGEPYLEEIIFRAIPDSHVRLQALEKGELDFITHPDAKDLGKVRGNPNLAYASTAGWNWDYQQFNLKKGEFPFQNKLVRQAISYAVDREAIRKEIYHGEATVTDSMLPYGFMGYRPGPLRYPKNGDLKKARELMAKAGCRGYEVEVITSHKDWLRRELELVAAMVSQIGIKYKIRNLDSGSYNNLWLNEQHEQLLEDITITAGDPDATTSRFLHSKGKFAAGYHSPELDKVLEEARASSDLKKREKLYHKVVDLTLEDCPKIYHVHANYVRVHKKGLVGFESSPQEYIELFRNVRWKT